MKKTLKLTAIIMALAMLFCITTISAFAVAPAMPNPVQTLASARSNSYPYPTLADPLTTSTSWKTIASSNTGFNCSVYIKCLNTTTDGLGVVPCDVRMLGKSGNVVWSENGAIPGLGNRTFWCGSDVYQIQIRTKAGTGSAICYEV